MKGKPLTICQPAFSAAAAQRPPKTVKLDFFLIHGITTAHAIAVLIEQPWISQATKVRILEWTGRLELAAYLCLGAPSLFIDEIRNYQPKEQFLDGIDGKQQEADPWKRLIERALKINDDGHASKTIRGLIHSQKLSARFENDRPAFLVKGDMWLKIGHMCKPIYCSRVPFYQSFWLNSALLLISFVYIGLDSVERAETTNEARWVRICGFPEAWKDFPNRQV